MEEGDTKEQQASLVNHYPGKEDTMESNEQAFLVLAYQHYWSCYKAHYINRANEILAIIVAFCRIYGIPQEEANRVKATIGQEILQCPK
jgi:hypothetical protein